MGSSRDNLEDKIFELRERFEEQRRVALLLSNENSDLKLDLKKMIVNDFIKDEQISNYKNKIEFLTKENEILKNMLDV